MNNEDTEDDVHQQIRRIAYGIWEREGRPEGQDRQHWETAKEIWAFRHGSEAEADGRAEPDQQASQLPALQPQTSQPQASRSQASQSSGGRARSRDNAIPATGTQ